MLSSRPSGCQSGDEALAIGAWENARAAFKGALLGLESAECLEGLGMASWWLDLTDLVFDSRERAYSLYLSSGDRRGAARMAIWLGWDCWAFRGETAIADGWLSKARRLLITEPACYERAWLEMREGAFRLLEKNDVDQALALVAEGIRLAEEARESDLETLGRSIQGLALVASGSIAEGMRCLDEANTAVISGEIKDLVIIGLTSCYLIAACERVRDYERAAEWCERLKAFSSKWGLRPLFAVCRTQYASLCIWRGTWLQAEQELSAAKEELLASRPAMAGDASVRLGELRRRQGRLMEARALFESALPTGASLLGLAAIALDNIDPKSAVEYAERYLRQIPVHGRLDRMPGLEILIQGLVELHELSLAHKAMAELAELASKTGTLAVRAATDMAFGCIALAKKQHHVARRHFEDGLDAYMAAGAPFEEGRARILLAQALKELGEQQSAIAQVQSAIGVFTYLSAELEKTRAQDLLHVLNADGVIEERANKFSGSILSRREVEIIRLVAIGLNNHIIAERLFISEHTVHRHLANILMKLDVNTRAAAVAKAAQLGLLITKS
jgi:LuxR family maltose regulon positive regulatory protein